MSLLRKPSQNFTENTSGSHAALPPPRSTPCPSATLTLRRLLFGLCVGTPHSKGGGDVRGTPYSHASSGPRLPNHRPLTAETAGATPEYPPNISNNILGASPNISNNIRRTPDAQSPNRRTPTSGIAGRSAENRGPERRESRAGAPRTSGPRPSTPPEPTRCTSIFPHAPGPIPGGTKPAIKPAIYAGSAAPSKLLHRDMPSRETRLRRHGPTYLRTRSYGRTLIYTTTGRRGSSDLTLFGSPSVRCAICI